MTTPKKILSIICLYKNIERSDVFPTNGKKTPPYLMQIKREVLLMCDNYCDEYKLKEIAREFNMHLNTAKVLINSCKTKVHECKYYKAEVMNLGKLVADKIELDFRANGSKIRYYSMPANRKKGTVIFNARNTPLYDLKQRINLHK